MHDDHSHTHGAGTGLEPEAHAVFQRGVAELVRMTEGLAFRPLVSQRYPLPLALAVYGELPDPELVRREVAARMASEPIDALEPALVLLELYASNQPGISDCIPDDSAFLGLAFGSKRLNGWIATAGDGDAGALEAEINARWKFRFVSGPDRHAGMYPLLNMLARYGFVYGRIPFGDMHALGHFVEDYTPGLVVCHGRLDDLSLSLSLAAMKMGVPAIVPPDYPFPLGRQARAGSVEEIEHAFVVFPNIRRMLDFPEIPRLPDFLSPEYAREKVVPARTWGDTPESFYILRKGTVDAPGVTVTGEPAGPMGVVLTVEAEPMDAFDRAYIEAHAAGVLSMMQGVSVRAADGRLVLDLAEGTGDVAERMGEALVASIRHEFPKIRKIRAEIMFDLGRLSGMVEGVRTEQAERLREIEETTEETVDAFVTCVGCSPFAPDHVCVLTPERSPQCGRPYGMLKTGALYGLDDMSNIHHRVLHSGMNSFSMSPKREVIDPVAGEWAGVNEAMWRLTGGRTRRVQLHALEDAPHTGCGCFKLIMFKTDQPRPGVGIMARGYKDRAPDGRTWSDLHHALGGKQAPGIAGAAPSYLTSHKFLAAHEGWKSVVWVSPEVAEMMGDRLPEGVAVGEDGE